MANTGFSGPISVTGNLGNLPAPPFGSPVPDPNQDAGPSKFYQGTAILDPRMIYLKDKVTGFTGMEQSFLMMPTLKTYGGIPAALASNNIAAAQNVSSGVAMTLVAANSFGVTVNVPYHAFTQVLNAGAVALAPIWLDFGFDFGTTVAGNTTVTVGSAANYIPGQPLVIAGAGNSAGTACLLTNVSSVNTAANTIVVANAPLASITGTAIGSGDLWGPSEIGFPVPLAHYPFIAGGPGLFLDTRQSLMRGVRIVGTSGGAGGTFTVRGLDVYNQPMSQTVTVAAGASTGWSLKTFKAILSVTPNFTDAHNYTVGTSDVFGFAHRDAIWEDSEVSWAGASMTSSTGFVAADLTSPATAATGDVRGTIQVSASGGGSGIGSTVSNGALSGLAVTGNRLDLRVLIGNVSLLQATQANPATLLGVTQS